ncbi:MAG: SagB/ThcOx family dehydrogenase [Bacteroidales bacterium]|nr:SagB/ThcOx family dehydrogenase [Bacteroidales bacterium]
MKQFIITCFLILLQFNIFAQDQTAIQLPQPQLEKGRPLMQVLNDRQSNRNFSERELPQQELANLLWAANGINRKDANKRTAPTSMNRQEIEVYVSTKDGLFRYDAQQHALITIHNRDIRVYTGMQGFVANAPLNLIIVADLGKMAGKELQENLQTAYIDAGYVSQNIYLYCASQGLATVVRGSVDREKLAAEMGLDKNFRIVVAHTVGFPGE